MKKQKNKPVHAETLQKEKTIVLCCNLHYDKNGKTLPIPMFKWKNQDAEGKEQRGFACSKNPGHRIHNDLGLDSVALQAIENKAYKTPDSPDFIPVYVNDFENLIREMEEKER